MARAAYLTFILMVCTGVVGTAVDCNSHALINFVQQVSRTLLSSTTAATNLTRISVVDFKNGSVIVNVLLEYTPGSTVTRTEVQKVLEDDIIQDNRLSDGVDVILMQPESLVIDGKSRRSILFQKCNFFYLIWKSELFADPPIFFTLFCVLKYLIKIFKKEEDSAI